MVNRKIFQQFAAPVLTLSMIVAGFIGFSPVSGQASAKEKPLFNPFCSDSECPYMYMGYTQCLSLYQCFLLPEGYYARCEPAVYEGQAALVEVPSCN